ncbi:MAG: flagellar biosynthetic protein FliR [Pseudomonadota bacterium]
MQPLLELLAPLLEEAELQVYVLMAVFVRVGAVVALLPGFGEQTLPLRVRLAAAIAMTLIVWPAVRPLAAEPPATMLAFTLMLLAEATAGLLLGIAFRLLIMVLQLAGSVAAQATSVAQIFGAGMTPDPLPALGNILVIAGIALALTAGLHVKAAAALSLSYDILPFGRFPSGSDVAAWGVARIGHAFALALTLAGPFVVMSFVYNVALGAISRAMPQLMVAFVGAPAITAAAILMFFLAAPAMLQTWMTAFDATLAAPFEASP